MGNFFIIFSPTREKIFFLGSLLTDASHPAVNPSRTGTNECQLTLTILANKCVSMPGRHILTYFFKLCQLSLVQAAFQPDHSPLEKYRSFNQSVILKLAKKSNDQLCSGYHDTFFPRLLPFLLPCIHITLTGSVYTTIAVACERCITVLAPFTQIKVKI